MEALFIGGMSAYAYWHNRRLMAQCPDRLLVDVLDDPMVRPADCERVRSLGKLVPLDARLEDLCRQTTRGLSFPVDVLVGQAGMRRASRYKRSRVWGTPVPAGAFVRVDDGVYMSSPAFCFAQLAASLDVLSLVRLANEMCGVYVPSEFEIAGIGRCPPLVALGDLARFVGRLHRVRGAARARTAVDYAVHGAASPMESALELLLCLPWRMGGYGFERPEMNYRIAMDKAVQGPDEGGYCLCDLFWPAAKVGIEYDSDLCHAGRESLYRDALRRNRLGTLDAEILTVTREQLMDAGQFDVVARQLARHLGRSMKGHDTRLKSWRPRAEELRRALLGPGSILTVRLLDSRRV